MMQEIKIYRELPSDRNLFHVAPPATIRVLVVLILAVALFSGVWLVRSKWNLSPVPFTLLTIVMTIIFSLMAVNATKKENWASFSMDPRGIYFRSTTRGEFILVPWSQVGLIAPGRFGVNKKGLGIQLLGEAVNAPIANVLSREGDGSKAWVQVKSDILNRKKLIAKANQLRGR